MTTTTEEPILVLKGVLSYSKDWHSILYAPSSKDISNCAKSFIIKLPKKQKIIFDRSCRKNIVKLTVSAHTIVEYRGKYLYLLPNGELLLTNRKLKEAR